MYKNIEHGNKHSPYVKYLNYHRKLNPFQGSFFYLLSSDNGGNSRKTALRFFPSFRQTQ